MMSPETKMSGKILLWMVIFLFLVGMCLLFTIIQDVQAQGLNCYYLKKDRQAIWLVCVDPTTNVYCYTDVYTKAGLVFCFQAIPQQVEEFICDCSSNIYNCADFLTQNLAQRCFDYCGYDIHNLDADHDGLACEELD